MDREHTLTLITGYDVKARHAINKRWLELESAKQQPVDQMALPMIELQIAETAARMLRMSDTSKIRMLSKLGELKGVDTRFLPAYIRYYCGIGTIHFYPTNKAVMDRLNRVVGKERQWLPEDESKAPKEFWKQYDKAEAVTKAMVIPKPRYGNQVDDETLVKSHLNACACVGIDVSGLLASC